jgi:hypothetical protein
MVTSSVFIVILLLIIHCVAAFFILFWLSGKLQGHKEYIIPVLLVPIFGPLLAATIELLFLLEDPGRKPVELESLRSGHNLIWAASVKKHEEKEAIPLEEAILINDIKTRRKVVLKTFSEDSFKYLDVLMVARHNEDVDTTHYATIQISKIQRQFQLDLQKYARAYEQDPKNLVLLDEYIDLLGRYLDSALPEENMLRHQRSVYAKLLEQKLSIVPNDQDALIRKLRNCNVLKENYPAAQEVMGLLQKHWPTDEQTWIESLRACVEWKDSERRQQTIDVIQHTRVAWTKQGREQVRPWVQL